MRGVFQIAKLFNIPVLVHWSFGLIVFWVLYVGRLRGLDTYEMLWLGVFMLSLFFCVVLHEFGHALTAKYYGVKTKDIILSPIGGVARLDKLPEKPFQEFMVAIMGPMVNIVIALILLPYVFIIGENNSESISEVLFRVALSFPNKLEFTDYFIPALVSLNITLVIFNMLPAFPMDGGRVLRALLSIPFNRIKATQIASIIGRLFAVLFIGGGLYTGSYMTALIGVFIYLMAANEYKMVKVDAMLNEHKVEDIVRTNFTKQYENSLMGEAANDLQTGLEKNFLVFNFEEEVVGVLQQSTILKAIKERKLHYSIGDYSTDTYSNLRLEDSLKLVFTLMQKKGYTILPVYEENVLKGVVDVSMLNNFLRRQNELTRAKGFFRKK